MNTFATVFEAAARDVFDSTSIARGRIVLFVSGILAYGAHAEPLSGFDGVTRIKIYRISTSHLTLGCTVDKLLAQLPRWMEEETYQMLEWTVADDELLDFARWLPHLIQYRFGDTAELLPPPHPMSTPKYDYTKTVYEMSARAELLCAPPRT